MPGYVRPQTNTAKAIRRIVVYRPTPTEGLRGWIYDNDGDPKQWFTLNLTIPIISATATHNSIAWSWTALPLATSYEYRIDGGAIQSTTATSVNSTGLTEGQEYTIEVRGVLGDVRTDWGEFSQSTTLLTITAPVVTASVIGRTSITFTWEAVSNAQSYQWRSTNNALGTLTTVDATTLSVTIDGLIEGVEYTFEVRAVRGTRQSDFGEASATTTVLLPSTPVNFQIQSFTHDTVTWVWDAAANATSYQVRLTSGGAIMDIGAVTTLARTGLNEGVSYGLEVRAVRSTAQIDDRVSAWTSRVAQTTTVRQPSHPDIISGTALSSSSIRWNWNAISLAEFYEWTATATGDAPSDVTRITATQLTRTGLSPNSNYNFRVRSGRVVQGTTYRSGWSSNTSVTTQLGTLPTPSLVYTSILRNMEVDSINGTPVDVFTVTHNIPAAELPLDVRFVIRLHPRAVPGAPGQSAALTVNVTSTDPVVLYKQFGNEGGNFSQALRQIYAAQMTATDYNNSSLSAYTLGQRAGGLSAGLTTTAPGFPRTTP